MNDITRPRITGRLIFGLGLIGFGLLFTLDNLGLVEAREILRFWPFAFIAAGAYQFWKYGLLGGGPGAWVFTTLGIVFALKNFGSLRFGFRSLFPMFLILIGAWIVAAHWKGPRARAAAGNPSTVVHEWAIFGGGERRMSTADFQGGDASAIFGGFELDLRECAMTGESASIDVFAFCGGGEIRVPPSWNVTMRVLPVFGGTDDKTVHPVREEGKAVKQLVVTGVVIFGGLGVKN